LRLDNQLCFALYAATHAMTKTYRERLASIGLTYPQYLVLDSGTLTPLIKRLEAAGIVTRRRDGTDERQVFVKLTAKGRALRNDALDVRRYVACRLGMSEPEILALRADIMAMVGGLNAGCGPDDAGG
jgi:DNA-binding PadR family transcriptional regulator